MYTALKLLVLQLFALTDQPLNTKQKISFIQYTSQFRFKYSEDNRSASLRYTMERTQEIRWNE